jgi:NTP pyrophosphatase (non-canonical NTP hydrolase)
MDFKIFFNSVKETAQYDDHKFAVVYPALGLAGETGEAVDIIKKTIRYGGNPRELGKREEAMKLELGDVMWYWCNLAIDLGFKPEELFQMNYDKLHERYNIPVVQSKELR